MRDNGELIMIVKFTQLFEFFKDHIAPLSFKNKPPVKIFFSQLDLIISEPNESRTLSKFLDSNKHFKIW